MRLLRIASGGLKGRKRDTAVLGSILFLAFLFLTLSSVLLSSFSGTARLERQKLHGAWQIMYYGVQGESAALRRELAPCAQIRLAGTTNTGSLIGTIDEDALETAGFILEEGRLPQGQDEILLVRGRMSAEPAPGETLDITYSYEDMQSGTEEGAESVQKEAVLASVRQTMTAQDTEDFRAYLKEHYDPKEGTVSFTETVTGYYGEEEYAYSYRLPEGVDADHPEPEIEEDLLYMWARYAYGPATFGEYPYAISSILRKDGELFGYEDISIDIDRRGFKIFYSGAGFSDEYRGRYDDAAMHTCAVMLRKTCTVVGYISPYADHWDVRGLSMPDAFVSPQAGDQVLRALSFAEQHYSEGTKNRPSAEILLLGDAGMSREDRVAQILPVYMAAQRPSFRTEGFTEDSFGSAHGFITGLDPVTGEEKTCQLHIYRNYDTHVDNYVLQDVSGEYRLVSGDPAEEERWEEFSDLLLPLAPPVLTFEELEQNNGYPLRLNNYAYPPSGNAGQSMQWLAGGVLIGVAAFSVFQVYWTQLRRRRMRLATMMSIGATDAQVLAVLLLEVALLLVVSLVLGTAFGFLAARLITGLRDTRFIVDGTALAVGEALCILAVLLGALIPMLLVRNIPLTGREQLSKRTLQLRAPRRTRRQTYGRILLRQTVVNRGRTCLQFLLALLLAVTLLLTLFLCHDAYGAYRRSVTDTAMPEYELVAPYGMSTRMMERSMELTKELREGSTLSCIREAPNVYLHCDTLLESSPILKTLHGMPEAQGMFRETEGGETGVAVRVMGASKDSALLHSLLRMLPADTVDLASLERGESCILLVPQYLPDGEGVLQKMPDPEALKSLRADELAGELLELHYADRYASVCRTDPSVRPGERITLTAYRQWLEDVDGRTMLLEGSTTIHPRVDAVIHVLGEGVWPFSENNATHIVVSGERIIRTIYPQANASMSAEQAAFHRIMAKIYYPDCYGLTRFIVRNGTESDPVTQDTLAADFAEELGLDFINYRIRIEREASSAQMRRMMFFLLGLEMSLVILTLLYSGADVAAEQDRYRIGTLQAFGVTTFEINTGQSLLAAGMAVVSCVAAHPVIALVHLVTALLATNPQMALRENLAGYPWGTHVLICVLFILSYTLMQSMPVRRVSRLDPIENIRVN
ncbi:MAG: ABC transporter permease [Lachnospiraceae bacterium]|nr:ABC transporter permease [Lachnospiraceae bacterium]